jgi:nucleotide-binding universal stress UspA family protein
MNILLAVDGSENSLAAADTIAHRPWPPNSEVKVLSVVRLPFTPTAETRALPNSDYARLEQAAMQQAQEAVDAAQARLSPCNTERDSPLILTTKILLGQQQEIILTQAEQWGADLIVLGSRGLGGFKRFLLGSVSGAVATHAPCSVEVVRVDQSHPIRSSHLNILLAVDGSPDSNAALHEVADCLWPPDSMVKIIAALEPPLALRLEAWAVQESFQKLKEEMEAKAHTAVEQAKTLLQQQSRQALTISSEIICGQARDVILETAEKWHADLIVLGSRGLSGVPRLLLGSVSSGVLSHAPCSVRIVRRKPHDFR